MKIKSTLILLVIMIASFNSYGVIDTLRNYDPTKVTAGFYSSATYPSQYERFEPKAPGYIKTIILTLNGTDTSGSVTVHIFGHSAGESLPEIETDLTTPLVFNKTVAGVKKVAVDLPNPVWVDNNQFFLKVTNFTSNNIRLLRDNIGHGLSCSSTTGGDYYYTIYANSAGDLYASLNAFAIDIIMDYTEGEVSPAYLKDVTASSGIDTTLSNNYVAWADINNDHYLDLLVSGRLYKNMGNGTFTDITASAGLTDAPYIGTFIDMNNDGKDDILSLGYAPNTNYVYINQGNETFVKDTLSLSLPGNIPISSFSVADWNNDGYPDLFVGYLWTSSDTLGYYSEKYYNYHLFMNDGNLNFKDTSSVIIPDFLGYNFPGFAPDTLGTTRCTRGAQFVDFNDDGKFDLYVTNYRLMADDLWKNNGNGTFTDVAGIKGLDRNIYDQSSHGTGVDWADYDNDGDMDLLLPQLAHPSNTVDYDHRPTTIYNNSGGPSYDFTDMNPGVDKGMGIEFEETHAGANWGDINNDGLLDFAICAFYGCRYSDIYLQKSDHTFELKSFDYGITHLVGAPDLTLVDYDNDGRLDLGCGYNEGNFRLYRNDGPSGNYVAIDLVSTSTNKRAVGAKVMVYAGGAIHTQYQMPYHGALMSDGNRIHFGLGNASKVDSVRVRWPDGTTNSETFQGVAINTFNVLTQGGNVQVGVKEIAEILSSFKVYPNPVTTNVNFDYTLVTGASVTLDIYSILGEKITVLNNDKQNEGQHHVQWDVKGKVVPGIYSYRLQIGEAQKTGLLIVQ